jgi:glucose-6-phosphate isomerase
MNHSSKPLISINTNNCYEAVLNAPGITENDLTEIQSRLKQVHEIVVEKTQGGLDAEFASLNLPTSMLAEVNKIKEVAADIQAYKHVIVIGIGGSSLGAKAISRAMQAEAETACDIHFAENIDPLQIKTLLTRLDPSHTALICISKSGGTIETVVQFLILRQWLQDKLGDNEAKKHQWFITDPDSGWLRELASRENIPALPVPPNVGGRYSVLSAVGLLPLAVENIDIRDLLEGAAANRQRCQGTTIDDNPALKMAAIYYLLDTRKKKRVSIMMPYANELKTFVDWYCQLWAESLGKYVNGETDNPAGTLPVRAIGAVDQHSQLQMYLESRLDKMFTFIELDWREHKVSIPLDKADADKFPHIKDKTLADVIHAEFCATQQVITDTGHPNLTLRMSSLTAHTLGQLIDLYQRTTIYAGLLYGINPLDQPAVEKGKMLTIQRLLGKH